MKLLDDYFKLQKEIHKYFGYEENWRVIPLEDKTNYVWMLQDEQVVYANTKDKLPLTEESESNGDYYVDEIYRQRFLKQHVYRTADYTMVCVDTHTDGNHFLSVYDNSKEVSEPE